MNKITIQQIAELAGVNKATVSRVLNGNAKISEKTREKILQIIKQYNYVPNTTARALATNKTFTVGFCFDYKDKKSYANPFFYKVLQGIENEIYSRDHMFLMMSEHGGKKKESSFARIVAERRVDGVLLPNTLLTPENVDLLERYSMPYVVLGEPAADAHGKIRWVDVDNIQAAAVLTGKLLGMGLKDIRIFAGPDDIKKDKFVSDRVEGYRQTMEKHGLPTLIVEQADELKTARPSPEAVVCCTHDQLFEMLDGERLQLPATEMVLATFDANPLFRLIKHPIHYMEIDLEHMGAQAAKLLFSCMNGDSDSPRFVRIPVTTVRTNHGVNDGMENERQKG